MRLRLLFGLIIIALTPAYTFALGAFFAADSNNAKVAMPGARVFIHRNGSREELILQAGFAGNATDFGWVIPVPSKPEVQYADQKIFDELNDIIVPNILPNGKIIKPQTQPTDRNPSAVRMNYVSIIAPTERDGVSKWLRACGYKVSDKAYRIITGYADSGWYFVVSRIKVQPKAESRWLQPLKISFYSSRAVLPAVLTSDNETDLALQMFVSAKVNVKTPGLMELGTAGSPAKNKYKMNEFPLFFETVTTDTRLTELYGVLKPKTLLTDFAITPK